jgi:hypothetical protein
VKPGNPAGWILLAWRVFIVIVLVTAVAIPIYGGVTDGPWGVIGGIYLGLWVAVPGLVLLITTLVIENIVRARRARPEKEPGLPEARVVKD